MHQPPYQRVGVASAFSPRFEQVLAEAKRVRERLGTELIDLTPFMREDILLNLPAYPRCDRTGERVCPAPQLQRDESDAAEAARKPDWSALDKLDL